MRQTAVDWLEKELKKIPFVKAKEVFEQAKQMEKEQIREAFAVGKWDAKDLDIDSNKYYQETYGKNG